MEEKSVKKVFIGLIIWSIITLLGITFVNVLQVRHMTEQNRVQLNNVQYTVENILQRQFLNMEGGE